jgi:hypothetical protein
MNEKFTDEYGIQRTKRERATEDGFVWIPTGNNGKQESGMVGYWHGVKKPDHGGTDRAEVEFLIDGESKYCLVNLSALYQATDEDIDAELSAEDVQKWRNL